MTDIEKLKELEAKAMPAWETYQDTAYYDCWAVRRVGETSFSNTFHLVSGDEARVLVAFLNEHAPSLASKNAEIARLNERLEATFHFVFDADSGEMKRVECKPGDIPDGIDCRNETIHQQNGHIERLAALLKEADAASTSKDAEIERLKAERGKALAAVAFIADEGTYSDSYGVPGSDFGVCRFCEAGGGPGVPFEHNKNCPILRCEQVAEQWWEDRQIDIEDAAELRASSAESRLTTALAALGEAKSGLVEIEAITPHKATRLCARAALAKLNEIERNADG